MEDTEEPRYWCHMCLQEVNPVMRLETIKCPYCLSGFVEEMAFATTLGNDSPPNLGLRGSDFNRALSLWSQRLLGLMGNAWHHPSRHLEFEDDDRDDEHESNHEHYEGELEIDQLEPMLRRIRNSAPILQLHQGVRAGTVSGSLTSEVDQHNRATDNDRNEEHMVLSYPFNRTIAGRGSHDPVNDLPDHSLTGTLDDYFIGPGLDFLLQQLLDNDPNQYGTPPTQKEAIEALITVKNEDILHCSVCLDCCEIGAEMKELPCRHKFHHGCILLWLELHSTCPVCRYQLPCDESLLDSAMLRNNSDVINDSININHGEDTGLEEENENWSRFAVSLPWLLNIFSFS